MKRKDLLIFLGLEIFAIIWAGAVFSILESKLLAGALAGGYFVLSGWFMLYRVLGWKKPWTSATLYPLVVHVFGVAIPMLFVRFMHADVEFGAVRIWGLPGPVFHQMSTMVFAFLIAATVIDFLRVKLASRGI